jgi:hypothetical protein
MIKKENYNVCSYCYEGIKDKGAPFVSIIETIFELFSITEEPVAFYAGPIAKPVLDYLEEKNYIITTEFPDMSDKNIDILLCIPKGASKLYGVYFFCFDKDNH